MKPDRPGKDLYRRLRALPWPALWDEEVARFNQATNAERFDTVSVVRAVGVVFSESGPAGLRERVREWLLGLLDDPQEKIRRYALAALPKIGIGPREESELLRRLETATRPGEAAALREVLARVGGTRTYEAMQASGGFTANEVQRVTASVARREAPTTLRLDANLPGWEGMRIHLRGRAGLEGFVRDEVEERGGFRVLETTPGLVALTPTRPFALADLFQLRCFATAGVVLGRVAPQPEPAAIEGLATTIASPHSQQLFRELTNGTIRYRLDFMGRGHARATVRKVVERAFEIAPAILNDAREAPWAVDVHPMTDGESVELRPRSSLDPRRAHRLGDVPAASHPPLAACLARAAGRRDQEEAWDPFCGSGQELIERALLGGVRRLHGTDLSPEAVDVAKRNFTAAGIPGVEARFTCCDFRRYAGLHRIPEGSLTLVITNPPLGRRVRVPGLRGLFDDLFATAARMLRPEGRLVLTNPFRMESPERSLQLESRRTVDLGGFDCRLEVYRKAPARPR